MGRGVPPQLTSKSGEHCELPQPGPVINAFSALSKSRSQNALGENKMQYFCIQLLAIHHLQEVINIYCTSLVGIIICMLCELHPTTD